jgi:nucleoside-diphosphate kinase
MAQEKTLIILKPDCLQQGAAGAVLQRFERAGFQIVACKMMALTGPLLREHYAHLANLPFFPEIERFMSSRPVLVLILAGDRAIDRVRELLGPTDSSKAPKGTIRGDLGRDKMLNIAHASDSPAAAETEIRRFFRPEEIFG